MVPDPLPLPSLRPFALLGLTAAVGVLAHRWWKRRRSQPHTARPSVKVIRPGLCAQTTRVEVPWGVEQPL